MFYDDKIDNKRIGYLTKLLSSILLMLILILITNNTSYATRYTVGGTNYSTLKAAIDGSSSGAIIKVTQAGGDTSNAVIPSGQSRYLDTNGLEIMKGTYPITIKNNATLSIIGNGKIRTLTPENNELDALIINHGKLRIGEKAASYSSTTSPTLENLGYNRSTASFIRDSNFWYVIYSENVSGGATETRIWNGTIRTNVPAGTTNCNTGRCIGILGNSMMATVGGHLDMVNYKSAGVIFANCTTTNSVLNGLTITSNNSDWCDGIRVMGASTNMELNMSSLNIQLDGSNSTGINLYKHSKVTLTLKSGTVVSGLNGIDGSYGDGTAKAKIVNLGVTGGSVSITSPEIRGGQYGIYNTSGVTVNFYDGIIKGRTAALGSASFSSLEPRYSIKNATQTISGTTYKTASLAQASVNPAITSYLGTYDGSPHTINVVGGSGGTIHYSVDNSNWSTQIPTRTEVGETTVYVKVVGDASHLDTTPISATITIEEEASSYSYGPKTPRQTIDITNAVTDSSISSHTCLDFSVDRFNDEKHWKICKVCYALFVEQGRPEDILSYATVDQLEVVNIDSQRELVIKDTIEDHSYTDSWTFGTPNDCHPENYHVFLCSCGFNYKKIDGRKEHSNLGYGKNRLFHTYRCLDCHTNLGSATRHKDASGTLLGCDTNTSGVCYDCGYSVSADLHNAQIFWDEKKSAFRQTASTANIVCCGCHRKLIEIDSPNTKVEITHDINDSRLVYIDAQYQMSDFTDQFTFADDVHLYDATYGTVTGTHSYEAGKIVKYNATVTLNDSLELDELTSVILSNVNYKIVDSNDPDNGERITVGFVVAILTDAYAPEIETCNIVPGQLHEGWSQTAELRVSGSENFSKRVSLAIKNKETGEYTNIIRTTNVNSTNKDFEFVVPIDLPVGEYTVEVEDNNSNITSRDIRISNIDAIPPTIIKSSTDGEGVLSTPIGWSKTKDFSIFAQDIGKDIGKIKIQDISNVFSDEFGYSLVNFSTVPKTWIRDYRFTGNIYGYKTLKVEAMDTLDNRVAEYFRVYNLDNTIPYVLGGAESVNVSDFAYATLADDYSGIKYFGIVDSISQVLTGDMIYPTEYATIGTTNRATSFDTWYQVPLVAASGDEPERGPRSIDVSLAVKHPGRYYVVMEDYVGNRNAVELNISNLDSDAPTGMIDVLNTITSRGIRYVNTQEVTLKITAEDDVSGVEKVAFMNEDQLPVNANNINWIDWENNPSIFTNVSTNTKTRKWNLSNNDGAKTVFLMIKDSMGNTTVLPYPVEPPHSEEAMLTYDANGHGTAPSAVVMYYADATNAADAISTVGYTFGGWNTKADGTGTSYAAGAQVKAANTIPVTTKLFAQWTEKTATLSYNANGHGTAPSSVTMKFTTATNAASAISATGYTFGGWNTKADGTGTNYAAGAQVKAANIEPTAMTLYAKWTENTATLSYNANGHGTAPNAETMNYSTATNAASAISANGWTFKGWNTKADGSGTSYAAGAQVKAANTIPSAMTLYAKWADETAPSAPTLAVSSGTAGSNGWYKSNVSVKVTAGSDSGSGVNRVVYKIGNGGETTITSGGTFDVTSENTTSITAYTYDNAGNKSSAASLSIKIDKTLPTINDISSWNMTSTHISRTRASINITLGASDSGGSGLASLLINTSTNNSCRSTSTT